MRVKKFLCCISLETGGLIVGWINLLLSIFVLIIIITAMSLSVSLWNNNDLPNQDDFVGGFAGK